MIKLLKDTKENERRTDDICERRTRWKTAPVGYCPEYNIPDRRVNGRSPLKTALIKIKEVRRYMKQTDTERIDRAS